MWELQTKIWDIALEQKEQALEAKAKDIWFGYVNFAHTKVQLEALNIIPLENARELKMVCFFIVQKKIRIALVNEYELWVKDYISKLKWEWYSVNINLCSDESFYIALQYYDKISKKTVEKDLHVEEDTSVRESEIFSEEKVENTEFQGQEFLNTLYKQSIHLNASDLHIEPQEKDVRIRFRIDWILRTYKEIEKDLYHKVIRIIKHEARMVLNQSDKPQDWRYDFIINNRKIDLRVSIIPTPFGESVVTRILDTAKWWIHLDQLGFLPFQLEIINKSLKKTDWILLVTWPTGSWKSSTLYSILWNLNDSESKIITLEDPIEFHLNWVVQSQIGENYSFNDWLKACLRHDPDIIMLWEIRDKLAARTAMQAAITWHLVLSTVHANTALDSLFRLKDLQVEDYLIASSINLIIGQRLIRKNCPNCASQRQITHETHMIISSWEFKKVFDFEPSDIEHYWTWCDKCWNTWYLWRETVAEVMVIDEHIRHMISSNASQIQVNDYLKSKNFMTMPQIALHKALKGITTIEEALRINI